MENRAGFEIPFQGERDHEARDDEKDVDAHESAADPRNASMEQDDRQYGDGAESIDIGAVLGRRQALQANRPFYFITAGASLLES